MTNWNFSRSNPGTSVLKGRSGGAYNFTTVGVDGGGPTQATLTGLRPFSKYAIVLQAFNSRGAGPSSPPTLGMTLEDSKFYSIIYSELFWNLKTFSWMHQYNKVIDQSLKGLNKPIHILLL